MYLWRSLFVSLTSFELIGAPQIVSRTLLQPSCPSPILSMLFPVHLAYHVCTRDNIAEEQCPVGQIQCCDWPLATCHVLTLSCKDKSSSRHRHINHVPSHTGRIFSVENWISHVVNIAKMPQHSTFYDAHHPVSLTRSVNSEVVIKLSMTCTHAQKQAPIPNLPTPPQIEEYSEECHWEDPQYDTCQYLSYQCMSEIAGLRLMMPCSRL